jgi:molybdopterin-guanine dinucleotide biosynthesis protein MobB
MADASPPADPIAFPVPMLGFAAFSGTGKTTLLLALLTRLKRTGLRIAVVKHAHHAFDIDHPGKDSYRLRTAGADEMLLAGRSRMAWIREFRDERAEPRLSEALAVLDPQRLDLVLVEGFKHEAIPKIELHRTVLGRPLLFPDDRHVVAIATDEGPLAQDPGMLPRLSIDDPDEIAAFVLRFIDRGERL